MTNRRRQAESADASALTAAIEITSVVGRAFPLYPVVAGRCACRRPDCDRIGKHPRVKWSMYASNKPATVRALFAAHPDSGVGIATGRGLLVLDADASNGGLASLDALQRDYEFLHTASTLTGRSCGLRGTHLWFRIDPQISVPSRAKALDRYPGIDVRCAGGMVVAPPTLHRSGVRYEWAVPLSEIADAPRAQGRRGIYRRAGLTHRARRT